MGRRKVATGDVIIARYADDLVMGFQHRAEAVRFLEEFKERLAKFGLELHPEKTRLIEFGGLQPTNGNSGAKGNRRPPRSWASPTTAGGATRPIPSPSGELLRACGWSRSSKQSRSSFYAGSMISSVRLVPGFGRWSLATTNTTLFPGISVSCAPSDSASIGSGETFWFVAANAQRRSGSH